MLLSSPYLCHVLHLLTLTHAVTRPGLDWWWIDWQQGLIGVSNVSGLNPTIALNHYRFWINQQG
jgi:hypothetical protein